MSNEPKCCKIGCVCERETPADESSLACKSCNTATRTYDSDAKACPC